MKKALLRVLGFGLLATVVVIAFLFNLSSILRYGYTLRAGQGAIFTGLASLLTVALFIWSIVSAVKESRAPEEPGDTSAQEQWEKAHPGLTDGSYRVEKKKEKHSAGYWVKEFMRLAGIPLLLFVLVWFGLGYLLGLL